jgi:hypothetical protein
VAAKSFKPGKIYMWLEQTIWIWAPLTCAAVMWLITRLGTLGREVRSLRMRLTQLEKAAAIPAATEGRARRAA